ncbi:MAG: hypothetical protein M3160_04055 [Candidatus Eremiobacteraeota bacterium]|nr:hypothetical protein [Candidatus Eremiobacteraeota bacterium]
MKAAIRGKRLWSWSLALLLGSGVVVDAGWRCCGASHASATSRDFAGRVAIVGDENSMGCRGYGQANGYFVSRFTGSFRLLEPEYRAAQGDVGFSRGREVHARLRIRSS